MVSWTNLAVLLVSAVPALAAFGVTESTASYVVDTGSSSGFVVTIKRSDCSITSLKYRSTEYQYSSQTSHIASGLGSATVSYTTHSGTYIKVKCVADNSDFDLTHYYVFKSGESIIYMATDTTSEPAIGELRYITRLDRSKLPDEYPFGDASNTSGGTAIEGSDVFLVNGETRSKFYSSERFIDNGVYCFQSSSEDVHACVVAHASRSYEKSSGGPFFRDINTNNNGDFSALTFYMNSNHAQTEAYRQGFHGPYALSFSRTGIPKQSDLDFSFFSSLSISGYTADSARGRVSGTGSGVKSGFETVVHWHNSNYQYWTKALSSGSFTSPYMVPGTYTMVLYQGELQVASKSVTVTAGGTTSSSIAATSAITTGSHTTVFQIGDWDGAPTGFRNAANQLRMHPSDSRMSSWGPLTYTVGTSTLSQFPMALFKSVNSPVTIKFTLSSAISSAATLRIGTTLAFASGRPSVTVGSFTKAFSAPTKIDSRGVTRGAYRGLGEVYDATIPAGTLIKGTNTITIEVISGSTGTTYLNPNFIFDAVELFY
ncbi:Rhamnogalacturonase B, N-terminal-domain-containing protein [Dactylonectria estremocensis]|uniref:Rhamnogalacturonate lyase n=1 Tax=Dactylonectria estremocensis TaxID=1079267 RepID=A0A9P9JIV2_9HYPO|nr:Rhamnogalacturonase B, N-terminal-domain-containing protein [Dactylonectria estremocensis]